MQVMSLTMRQQNHVSQSEEHMKRREERNLKSKEVRWGTIR